MAGVGALAGCAGGPGGTTTRTGTPPTETGTGTVTSTGGATEVRAETVATGFEIPWGAAYADGTLYLTERPGRIVRVVDGEREFVADLRETTAHIGEGGLLGLVFHPDDSSVAFVYQTYDAAGPHNRILRYDAPAFEQREVVLDGIPGAPIHDGGRLIIGPEGALFATCGDAAEAEKAQDPATVHGTVLRLTPSGDPHPDNPHGPVFSFGHRNPQGLAFRDGVLYSTEHGPDANDEINRLEAGNNYGWPVVEGKSNREEFTDPLISYTPTIAPASAAIYDGPIREWRDDLLFGTLAGQHLHRARITSDGQVGGTDRLFEDRFGRLRTVFTGPESHLYAVTSNRDGRATGQFPRADDDRVIRFRPA